VKEAKLACIKKLAAPALGFLAFPAGQALSLQGFNLVLGALQGPVAVTAFATSRTLARVNFQLVNTLALALWPELSSAFGAGNIQLARKLHRHAFQAALMVSLMGSAALWLAGPSLYRIWIRGAVPFDATCFHVLLLVTIANSFWYTSSVVPMSTNEHRRIALAYVIGTAFSLALAWVLIPYFGVIGASLALLVIDAAMTWLVLGTALRQVGDHAGGFLGSIFTLPFSRRIPEAAAVRNV
jgi:O-antigen/teichoic acid export membrane protein